MNFSLEQDNAVFSEDVHTQHNINICTDQPYLISNSLLQNHFY